MQMVFTVDEVRQILRKHVEEKLGIPEESVQAVVIDVGCIDGRGFVRSFMVVVKTDPETIVPAGPYRTSGKK